MIEKDTYKKRIEKKSNQLDSLNGIIWLYPNDPLILAILIER
jgi:hypothetical protein